DRARSLESDLLRARCDAAFRPKRALALDARLAVVARRVRRLCAAARAERRAAHDRELDARAAESAALDALERGVFLPDPGRLTPPPPRAGWADPAGHPPPRDVAPAGPGSPRAGPIGLRTHPPRRRTDDVHERRRLPRARRRPVAPPSALDLRRLTLGADER